MALDQVDIDRRIRAKRNNERVKLLVSTINALAIGIAASAILLPAVSDASSILAVRTLVWFGLALALHSVAQLLFGLLKSED